MDSFPPASSPSPHPPAQHRGPGPPASGLTGCPLAGPGAGAQDIFRPATGDHRGGRHPEPHPAAEEAEAEEASCPGGPGAAPGARGDRELLRGSLCGQGSREARTLRAALGDGISTPQTGPVEEEAFLKAAVEGKMKVIEKFLADGGSPDTCDQVRLPPTPSCARRLPFRAASQPPTWGPR